MFKFALALVAALFVSTTAYAEGISSKGKSKVAAAAQPAPAPAPDTLPALFGGMPSGLYVGVGGAQALTLVDLDIASLGSNGFLGNVHVGYDYRFGREGKLGVGVGVAHWFGETDSGILQLRPGLEIFGRVNYYLPSNAMLFAGGQYKKAEMTLGGITSDVDGFGGRVGVEFPVVSQTSLTLQYTPTQYDTRDQLGQKTWEHVVGANLSFRF